MKNIKTLTHSLNRKANRHFFTKELLVPKIRNYHPIHD